MTIAAGIHALTADEYHADPCDRPSLSASIAHVLCEQSPAHARAAHPKLGPKVERDGEEKFDVGTAAHSLFLQGDDIIEVVYAPDWRTKVAQQQREEARAAGRIPLLVDQDRRVREMVAAIREQIATHEADPPLFTDGRPEQTVVWEEDGVLCRSRIDWLRHDHLAIDDLKTTAASANPEAWTRTMLTIGADIEARFHARGVKALTGVEPEFRFVVVENKPPYALSVVSLAPSMAALADDKIGFALATWKLATSTGRWPGYTRRVAFAESPAWAEARWLEREAREDMAA
ncbi:MAG TPA: PD-(D/E)XK nuclease-like domain-containing protein [Gaiellaceae bacterium]|nr:PD-(D/E)XK nuclease-like domain-containing protein [Gaiellaceae bacterium]